MPGSNAFFLEVSAHVSLKIKILLKIKTMIDFDKNERDSIKSIVVREKP